MNAGLLGLGTHIPLRASLSFSPKDILKRGLGREGQGRSLRHKDTTTASQASEESSDLPLFVSF